MRKFLVPHGSSACNPRKRKQVEPAPTDLICHEIPQQPCIQRCTNRFKCTQCDYGTNRKDHLAAHTRTHTGEKPYTCDFNDCKYTCATSGTLITHKRTHTGEKPYTCYFEGCGYTCTTSGALVTHTRTHTGEKPYTCDFEGCAYRCIQSGHLINHKRTHTGEKPYTCDFEGCGFACTRSGAVVTHKRTHTGEKPYTCDFEGCGYTCTTSGALVIHKRTHTGEKPYTCDFEGCGYTCTTSGALVIHKRTHTGEKPYTCNFEGCDYASRDSRDLVIHKRTHTGEKPYICDFPMCGFAASQSGGLVIHKRTHTGEKPYICDFPMCGFAASQSGHLSSHQAAMHSRAGQARHKKAERRVELALQRAGYTELLAGCVKPPTMHYRREFHVDFKCVGDVDGKFARVDFMVTTASGRLVALEVDEGQHRFGYGSIGCDMKRMTKIYESLAIEGNMQLTFLRYNPDAYKVAGQLQKIKKTAREEWLLQHLAQQSSERDGLAVEYAHYDSTSASATHPSICDDLGYDTHLRQIVCRVGV